MNCTRDDFCRTSSSDGVEMIRRFFFFFLPILFFVVDIVAVGCVAAADDDDDDEFLVVFNCCRRKIDNIKGCISVQFAFSIQFSSVQFLSFPFFFFFGLL